MITPFKIINILILSLLINSFAYGAQEKGEVDEIKKTTVKKYKKKKYRKKYRKKTKKRRRKVRRKRVLKKDESSILQNTMSYLDITQSYVASGWIGFNHDLDMFFSGQRYKKSENKSKILLSYSLQKAESRQMSKAFEFGFKIHLPKLSKKLSVVIEKQRDEILEAQSTQAAQGVDTPERGYTAGLRYLIRKTPYFTSSLSTGIRLDMPLDPFAKLKLFKLAEFSFVNIYMGQKFIYFKQDDNLRSITELNFSKKLSQVFSLTQGNALTWSDDEDRFLVRNYISLGQFLNSKSAMSYSVGGNAIISPVYRYESYDASIIYRRSLYKKWLSGQLSFGSTFDREDDFEKRLFVGTRLDILMR